MASERAPTLKQLSYFAALADAAHYRKAAERVGISQPSLSLQISNLEKILRVQLVERGRAGALLTPAGREVLKRAKRILADVSELVEVSEDLSDGLAGTYSLGASATLGPYLLPSVVRQLHDQFPSLRLIVRDGAPRDLLDDLLAGRLDVILTQLPVQSTDVTVKRLFREPLRLVVGRDHWLTKATTIRDADLRGESLLALSSRFTLHAQITELAHEVGAILRQEYEGTSLDALRQMVAMRMGITFLPALYVASEIPKPDSDVVIVPFRKGRLNRSIGIVWRKSSARDASLNAFADVIRAVARDRFGGVVQMES